MLSHKSVGGEEVLYCTGRAVTPAGGVQLLLELRFAAGAPGVQASTIRRTLPASTIRCTLPVLYWPEGMISIEYQLQV